MGKFLSIVLFFIILLGGSFLYFSTFYEKPTPSATVQVAVVDWDKVLSDLPAIKAFKENLNKEFQKYQKEFQEKENKLRLEHQSIVEMQKSLKMGDKQTSIILEQRRQDFDKKVLEVQKQAEAYQAKLNEFHHKSLEEFHNHVTEKIRNFAKARGIQVVLRKSNTVFVDSSIDLTEDIMHILSSIQLPAFNK